MAEYGAETRERILAELEQGKSLVTVCEQEDMPNRATVQRWQADDVDFDAAVTRAREFGFEALAVEALNRARNAKDAQLSRLEFDATRWYLGKLSNAFSDDKTKKHELSGSVRHELIENVIVDPASPDSQGL